MLRPIGYFVANGLIIGGWAAAIPIVARNAGLDETSLAVVLLSFAVGGMMAMLFTPAAIDWIGTNRLCVLSAVGFSLMFATVFGISDKLSLALSAFVFGGFHGTMDVAMNAGAIEAEKVTGTRFMSKLHGCFSLGAALGAASFGLISTELEANSALFFSSAIVAFLFVIVFASRTNDAASSRPTRFDAPDCEAYSESPQTSQSNSRPLNIVPVLGSIAFCCLVAEGAMVDWLVKLFQTGEHTSGRAGFVYASFAIGMSACRFAGDLISTHIGDRRTIVFGCLVSSVSLAAVLLTTDATLACVPALVAGAGLANVIPSTFRACGSDSKQFGRILARVTTIGYAGFLFGPPIIGVIADASSLRLALVVPVASLAIASMIATRSGTLKLPANAGGSRLRYCNELTGEAK
ncbi:Inner membrane protein YbjJ [Stieleria maiorica]|uniref:Inner membrane protein YbjJ n=1 Tax=Stieleria maiorica TaxID=2795974 RepID=A0A5B9MNX6_9BACT|nr:MFS transporter [Stieleria maiorica]QEG00538.1 Inner membrane protein YbjJ [Stieleria maiorica]